MNAIEASPMVSRGDRCLRRLATSPNCSCSETKNITLLTCVGRWAGAFDCGTSDCLWEPQIVGN